MGIRLSLLLLLVGTTTPLYAQPLTREVADAEALREVLSARAIGMGGAWRALGLAAESGVGNPAALALYPTYRIELTGGWDWAARDLYGMVAISDAVSSPVAAGVSYQLVSLEREGLRRTVHVGTLGSGVALGQSLLVGVSARYAAIRGDRTANPITGDVGLLARLGSSLTVGLSGHNLVDTGSPEFTRYFSAHAGLMAGLFLAAADVRADFTTGGRTTLTYNAGAEYLVGQAVPVRVGYTYDGFTGASRLGAGLGLMWQGGGVDLGYRHDFGNRNGRLLVLSLKVQIQ